MQVAVILLPVGFMIFVALALCKAAGEADRRMEEIFRNK